MSILKKINPVKTVREALGANGVFLIVVAAVLLIVINIIQYKFAEKEINEDLRLRALSELSAKSLAIQNIMNEVETAVRNHTEDVVRQIEYPDSMFSVASSLVAQNPVITGSAVSFIENFYPSEGKWFEAFAVRNDDDGIETMQLGNETHDYFRSEFFISPFTTGRATWTNPYLDKEGAKKMLTTYSVPIFDNDDKVIAVLDADVSLDWLDTLLTVEYAYPSSYHVLMSKTGQLMSVADKNYLLKTIPEMAADYGNASFESLNEGMMSGQSGSVTIKDKKGESYRAFYMPVDEDTGWTIAIINSEKEIFGDFRRMKAIILWLSISGFVVIIIILVRALLNIKRLQKVTIESERIAGELQIAREIQESLLPKQNLLEEGKEKIDVCGRLIPAKEVGGDLYDYFIKDSFLFFCIGDVSGKGVPASLFMTVARSLFRNIASHTKDSAMILYEMNNSLAQDNESNMFVTLFVGVLDLKTGRLNYSNAGHDAPYIIDRHGVSMLKVLPNLPLGVFSDFEYKNQQLQLRKGSLIFLYTDGVPEAMNSTKEEFGDERTKKDLAEINEKNPEISPGELVEKITSNIREFVNGAEQSDDITMLAFRFQNNDSEKENRISFENNLSVIPELNTFVDKICDDNNFSASFTMELKLAIEEAVANVINYSYGDEKGIVEVVIKIQEEEVLVEIKDRGKEFDPTQQRQVDTNAPVEEREIGGLGIHLLRQLTDTLYYRRANDYNILTFSKLKNK